MGQEQKGDKVKPVNGIPIPPDNKPYQSQTVTCVTTYNNNKICTFSLQLFKT